MENFIIPTEAIAFTQTDECITCFHGLRRLLPCPRNTAFAVMAVTRRAIGGGTAYTSSEVAKLVEQLPALEDMAVRCASGVCDGDVPIEMRANSDGVTLHAL